MATEVLIPEITCITSMREQTLYSMPQGLVLSRICPQVEKVLLYHLMLIKKFQFCI